MTYQHKKAWTVITDICKRVGIDVYPEYDEVASQWYLRTFLQEDIINNAGISYGINLTGLGEFGVDTTEIYNRAIVYGKTESDNILLLKSEDDLASQNNLWIKDRVFNESDLSTMADVEDKASYEVSAGVTVIPSGRLSCICNPTFRPGDTIPVSIPYCGINGYYKIQKFTHIFNNIHTTDVEVSKKIRTIKDLFIPKINAEEIISSVDNPNDMRDSYTVYFDESPSVMSHAFTEEANGVLRLQTGETTGYAIADTITTDYDVTSCELRRFENYATDLDVYYVSNDGGINWEEYDISTGLVHIFNVPGNRITFKIELNRSAASDPTPQYASICLLYK
jgi:hypothetical protein